MIIFIDFDDVIFNTKKFRDDLIGIFFSFGVSEEMYKETYYDSDCDNIVKTYDPLKQINRLGRLENIDEGKMIASVNAFLNDLDSYVFSDVTAFLKSFECEDVNIVSYGDPSFQKRKIDGSGVGKYCKDIIVTKHLKSKAIAEIMKKNNDIETQKIIFIDDRNEQIEDIKRTFPFILTVLIKRPEGRYQEKGNSQWHDYEVCSLDEAKSLIKEISNN